MNRSALSLVLTAVVFVSTVPSAAAQSSKAKVERGAALFAAQKCTMCLGTLTSPMAAAGAGR